MPNIAVVTDSTAYLSQETLDKYGITVVPLSVVFGEEAYEEEIDITTDEFYKKMSESQELPTTSQPVMGTFLETFEKLGENHDAIISIHLSSGISGTYSTAVTVGETVEEVDVHCFDSEVSCAPQGYYVIEAAKMAQDGHSVDDIMTRLSEMRESMRAYFVVDNLNHLHRGGRLNGAQAIVGSLLKIKPVLHFEDKLIVPFEKVRTAKKAVNRVYELLDEDAAKGEPIRATVIHAQRPEKAEEIRNHLDQKYDNLEIDISYFGPVIGTHLGEGSIGIGWYKQKD
ncbi:DegV family protein [Thalassobacillus sp. C254]|uniref:DegV family protein n=1 Tax=Thalassobacillus sp. C254 TaxID=1225341 RepID=UPI0006D26F42|nr:DegV family protein [Thalassobacillus sp. C254]